MKEKKSKEMKIKKIIERGGPMNLTGHSSRIREETKQRIVGGDY